MDFPAFKEMSLNYKAEQEGQGLDFSSGLVVTSLCKASSVLVFRNNLQHQFPPPDSEWIILDVTGLLGSEGLQLMVTEYILERLLCPSALHSC